MTNITDLFSKTAILLRNDTTISSLILRTMIATIVAMALSSVTFAAQTNIVGPFGSGQFGAEVTALPNGNFVVVDPLFDDGAITDVGAVYLYNGTTLALISTLIGSTTGDSIGSGGFSPGIIVLTNGNFVVRSQNWDDGVKANVGAVTWCNGTTGCNGIVSSTNSLIGGSAGDQVGSIVTSIPNNGNYVVATSAWDNPSGPVADAGAVTWCNGSTGRVGIVTSANSLIGGGAGDLVGNGGIRLLSNGHYVVPSSNWDNPAGSITDAGAVTWGNGFSGTIGVVSSANSLVGLTVNDVVGRSVGGNRIVALTNGNYVVPSQSWDNPTGAVADVGAVTWCNGNGSTVGAVSAANSLIGGTSGDWVGVEGITALTNGNYVVNSALNWRDPVSGLSVGAVTWGNGLGGTVGLVSAANSLIGARSLDRVGIGGVFALTNGNYVVSSYGWDNPTGPVSNVGAVTLGNGNGGTVGLVTTSNSLVGGRADDNVGFRVIPLTNGHYVTASQSWDNPTGPLSNAGAATWCNGTTGRTGLVAAANSLTGSKGGDSVGTGLTALSNGNYVVGSTGWQTASFIPVGAATLGNGTSGTTGLVSTSNSLTGTTNADSISNFGITALTNGNYVVSSSIWDNPIGPVTNVGALTWASGTSGLISSPSNLNSLIGATSSDQLGAPNGAVALANGNYVTRSTSWNNPTGAILQAGAITLGNGTTGSTGTLSAANTVMGTVANQGSSLVSAFNDARNYLIVGRGASNTVTILSNSAFSATLAGNFNSAATWGGTSPTAIDIANVPSGITVTVPSAGANFAGLVSVAGTLNGSGTLNANLASNTGGTIAPGTSPGQLTVNGNVNLVAGSTFSAEINGTTVGTQYDQLKVNGNVLLNNATLNLSFGFTPVLGTTFRIIDNDGSDPIGGTFNGIFEGYFRSVSSSTFAFFSYRGGDGNDLVVTISTVTAAQTSVSGRVMTADGNGIKNAFVNLVDQNGIVRTARTGSFGYYRIDGVDAGNTYVIGVSSKRFIFAPRAITIDDDLTDIDFIAT